MIRIGGSLPADQRLVLRVWRSHVILSTDATSSPLWIGTVVVERIDHVACPQADKLLLPEPGR